MNGFTINLESETIKNSNFRTVLYTARYSQLVLMSLKPGEEIGSEVHGLDQFFRIEAGEGKAILGGEEVKISDGSGIVVPAGTEHNVINTSSDKELKLYTIYSPADHNRTTIHKTKAEALADQHDHFDGKTSLDK